MKHLKQFFVLTLLLLSTAINAQKIVVTEGDFDFLKDQKEVNVLFRYDKMTIYKDSISEAQYIEDHTKMLNERESGKGDAWAERWASSAELVWEPKFLKVLNRTKKQSFSKGNETAKYTLIVETVWIHPGFFVGPAQRGARVSTELIFVETTNMDNIQLKILSENAIGNPQEGVSTIERRIEEGFGRTARALMKMLKKKMKR